MLGVGEVKMSGSFTDLERSIFGREKDREDRSTAQQILDFERVYVRIMGRFVVVEHKVHGIR